MSLLIKNGEIITAHLLRSGKPMAECWETPAALGTLSSIAFEWRRGTGRALLKMCEQNQHPNGP